ncbi:MAG: glycoside hydrolase family 3 C-terminal domain-containing protein [Lachnospiraceae bacterium]|nr:glycoside hydrolase family 3 C-terminal domain-containing protein [Lachnospiraceae bacterium]
MGEYLEKDYKSTPFGDKTLGIEERIDWLISELTLDEKLHMLASGSGGVERLGIPMCKLGGEAAHGVEARNDQNGIGEADETTSFPQPIGMSSSWDTARIREAGKVTGKEARAVYSKRLWGGLSRWAPTIDLLRDPRWGRNEEAYGEDPMQVGAMSSAYIRGMQGDEPGKLLCAATLKHFYANNTEIGRGWKNSSISPRNKYELYLEPFRRAIEDGKVEGVMTAYNRINGVQGLFNSDVKKILKEEFGLTHAVSDGGAMELAASFSHVTGMNAETAAISVKAGVDALSGKPDLVYEAVRDAYEMGLLDEEDIDTAIRNTYRTRLKLGVFDEHDPAPQDALSNPDVTDQRYDMITYDDLCTSKNAQVCKELSDASVVLLKNDGILPKSILSDTVLIGPVGDKWYQDWYGGSAPRRVSVFDGLKEYSENMTYTDGCDVIKLKCGDKYLCTGKDDRLMLGDEPGTFVLEDWGEGSYTLRSAESGKYIITRLTEDAEQGIATAEEQKDTGLKPFGEVYVNAGQIFSWFDLEVFRIEQMPDKQTAVFKDRFGNPLCYNQEGLICSVKERILNDRDVKDKGIYAPLVVSMETVQNGIEAAKEKAAVAKTVILALGHHPMVNAKEEVDRATIEFIPYQQKLFDEIYKVNRNIIVVLLSDYPFSINEINDKARAVIWSATGSECMGNSIADTLTGKVHPAGRLTQTWFKSDADLPDIDDYDIIGNERTYRYFKGDVLYPFGYGLDYTELSYSDMKVEMSEGSPDENPKNPGVVRKNPGQPVNVYDRIRADKRRICVKLKLTNTGEYVSDEVVQIYAKFPVSRIKRPLKQLIAFDRVKDIAPGETRAVAFDIPVRELACYDVISESLIIEQGTYEICAGASSEDIRLSRTLEIAGTKPGLRDMWVKIKADHYDEQSGTQIVEGLYGYNALMPCGLSVYEPSQDGHMIVSYRDCSMSGCEKELRIHGIASSDVYLKVYIDDKEAGSLKFNTREYEKNPSEAKNRMPRAVCDEEGRKGSWPLLWADIRIPLDMSAALKDSSASHTIRIEADGPFKYDWFMCIGERE